MLYSRQQLYLLYHNTDPSVSIVEKTKTLAPYDKFFSEWLLIAHVIQQCIFVPFLLHLQQQ